jgi:RNA polymerase I-specific transcription initiation factor RRN7
MHPEKEDRAKRLKEELQGSENDRSSSSSSESEGDPDLEALMRENSELASSSSDEGDGNLVSKPVPSMKEGFTRRHLSRVEGPLSTVAVLMLTCWTMRLAVICTDFIRWVKPISS